MNITFWKFKTTQKICEIFLFVARFDAAEQLAALAHFGDDFFLHQIEAHGDQGHADDEVHGTEDEGQFDAGRAVDLVAGHQIAKARRAQTDEAKVRAVQVVPVRFPLLEQDRSADDVTDHHGQWNRDGHCGRRVVRLLRRVLRLMDGHDVMDGVERPSAARYRIQLDVVKSARDDSPMMNCCCWAGWHGRVVVLLLDGQQILRIGLPGSAGALANSPPRSALLVVMADGPAETAALAQFHVTPSEAGGQEVAHIWDVK